MSTKFQNVIKEYNKRSYILGDDEAIQSILASCRISIEELPELASFLAEEFERRLQGYIKKMTRPEGEDTVHNPTR